MGWFGNRRRAFLMTSRAMAPPFKNISIDYVHKVSVRNSQRTANFAETKIWFCLWKYTSTLRGQHAEMLPLWPVYIVTTRLQGLHTSSDFIQKAPTNFQSLQPAGYLWHCCTLFGMYTSPLSQSHPANIVIFNPLPSPKGPQRAYDTPLRKPLKLFCVGNLPPRVREIRIDFSWFSSVCLRNCWPQRPTHLTGYSKTGPGEICSRMCTFLVTFVWSSALENGEIQRIAVRHARLSNISLSLQ
jgi:hypothetical protein